LRPPAHAVRRPRLARDLLHDRHGALTDERDRHRVGAHAVARDAAGSVGGVEEDGTNKASRQDRIGSVGGPMKDFALWIVPIVHANYPHTPRRPPQGAPFKEARTKISTRQQDPPD